MKNKLHFVFTMMILISVILGSILTKIGVSTFNLVQKTKQSYSLFQVVPIMRESSVEIFKDYNGKLQSMCSGVVYVNKEHLSIVITAHHCLVDDDLLYVEGIQAVRQIYSMNSDTAILILDQKIPFKKQAILNRETPLVGDFVAVFGFGGGDRHYDYGTFLDTNNFSLITSGQKTIGIWVNLYKTSASVTPGCSGGGLYNKQGEVIGINVIRAGDVESFAVPISQALDIIGVADLIQDSNF